MIFSRSSSSRNLTDEAGALCLLKGGPASVQESLIGGHSERAVSPLAAMRFPCGVKTSLSGVKVLLISEHEPRTSVPGVFA